MFDNETGQYHDDEAVMNGDWYEDEEWFLYIVLLDESYGEVYGPDNEIHDAICRAYQERLGLTDQEMDDLGLTYIYPPLRRFNETDGYYHA